MARILRNDHTGPYRIEPEDFPKDKPMFICACGLSKNMPFCDGAHKTCRSEEEGKLYKYSGDDREEVAGD